MLKATKESLGALKDWEIDRFSNYLTAKQFELLKNRNMCELKKLLKKQLEKEKKKLEAKKEIAIEKYNAIKELGDITQAQIEIIWSQRAGAYGFQCYCFGRVWYGNKSCESYKTEYTGGCGYDKASSALSYFCNKLLKIIILNIIAVLAPIRIYETMFKNLGYKTKFRYLQHDNILIDIEK